MRASTRARRRVRRAAWSRSRSSSVALGAVYSSFAVIKPGNARAGLVFVTAFPSFKAAKDYLCEIAWETEVWFAETPSHILHYNGKRFLGPYT
jgi:BsuBI/PstI restriction endonuclease domain